MLFQSNWKVFATFGNWNGIKIPRIIAVLWQNYLLNNFTPSNISVILPQSGNCGASLRFFQKKWASCLGVSPFQKGASCLGVSPFQKGASCLGVSPFQKGASCLGVSPFQKGANMYLMISKV